MKKEFKNAAIDIVKLKKVNIIATSGSGCETDMCMQDECTTETCSYDIR